MSQLRARCAILLAVVGPSCSDKRDAAPSVAPAKLEPTTGIDRRADELIAKMTLEEKLGQLNQYTSGHTGIGGEHVSFEQLITAGQLGSVLMVGAKEINQLQHVAMEKSRLHIPVLFAWDVIHGYRTTFPPPLALASTWDPELVQHTAAVAAREAAADGVRWTFAPMVDIAHDSRWGRVVEGAGEDPYLGSVMAKAYVAGFQGARLSDPTSIAACAKHYVGYGAAEAGRDYNSAYIPEAELRNVYLPPFKAAVDSGVATIMSAFNVVNGVPASANTFTLGILRKEYRFAGFVVSDYGSVGDSIQHGVAKDGAAAARMALVAGVDMDMESSLYLNELAGLIKSGKVPVALVDEAVRRILRIKLALGLFEHPYVDEKAPASELDLALAKQAALESFVLLKNGASGAPPPLPIGKAIHRIALIGPMADDAANMLGAWAVSPQPARVTTLRTALGDYAKSNGVEVAYERGVELVGGKDAGIPAAVAAARRADLVVLSVGEPSGDTGEAASRTRLDLTGLQPALFDALAKVGKPIVMIVFSGRALTLTPYVDRAAAIVQAWEPGLQAGPALVDVLTGAASFSGKLTLSMPRAVGQLPLYYNALSTGKPIAHVDLAAPMTPETKYRSRYLDEVNDPLFPFGYGLSYTSYEYSPVTLGAAKLSAKALNAGAAGIKVHATVKNVGARDGVEIAQLYIRLRGTSIARPVRELKGLQRVPLHPGETRELEFTVGRDELSFWNIDMKYVVEPAAVSVWVAPDAKSGTPAEFTIAE